MSQPHAALLTLTTIHADTLFSAPVAGKLRSHATEELFLLQGATESALVMLQFFREELSKDPRIDLKAAFAHIDNALAHSNGLLEALDTGKTSETEIVQHAIRSLSSILSNIPQVSYMSNGMLRSYYEIKDMVAKLKALLAPLNS